MRIDWKAVALVSSGIAIGCVGMRASESSQFARADEPGSQRCEWGTIRNLNGPDTASDEWQRMGADGAQLEAITANGYYIFERCR